MGSARRDLSEQGQLLQDTKIFPLGGATRMIPILLSHLKNRKLHPHKAPVTLIVRQPAFVDSSPTSCDLTLILLPVLLFYQTVTVRTWKHEHFEFHGQCDIVMASVKNFANHQEGIDLDIHLRTNMVRYWSYIKAAAIRIGNDILEVEGSLDGDEGDEKRHYHINFEYRGPLDNVGGYPVTINPRNDLYTIHLDKDFPGQAIEIKTFKEFVSVKIVGATEESFGKSVGITGDFKSGKTLARDGVTVIDDFNELGMEWQVLPSDGKLFHEMARPQFPELCYLPEDPRGDRARRLVESEITLEEAEQACASLKDPLDRTDCVYDVLATQDMEMVGAF